MRTETQQQTEVLTVTQLSLAIKRHLETRFSPITVQGEVSNLKEQSSGHVYFTLKDAESQISAVLFKGNARSLTRMPKNGDHIIIAGEINVYPPRGAYQIIVRSLTYAGVGALLLQLHEMKLKLQQRGWFDASQKKSLPKYPKTIGVVTSPTGSVIQDILHILTRRLNDFHLIINPVKVQGEGSAKEIAQAIEQFNAHCLADVIIVGRGGGSLEDLWPFNEEIVASAIFHSRIPIISAVGHETDYSIADFVADVRAPTPSAAAEIVTAEKAQQIKFLFDSKKSIQQVLYIRLNHLTTQLSQIKKNPYFSSPYLFLSPYLQRYDDYIDNMKRCFQQFFKEKKMYLEQKGQQVARMNPKGHLFHSREKLHIYSRTILASMMEQLSSKKLFINPYNWRKKLDASLEKSLSEKKQYLCTLIAHLRSIDPKQLLTKGYCILFKEKLVYSTHDLKEGDHVHVLLQDGKTDVLVERVYPTST